MAQDTGRLSAFAGGATAPAMLSCLRGGEIIYQTEMTGSTSCYVQGSKDIPVGPTYDVRVESDGSMTEVKRGIVVTAGNSTHLTFNMTPGNGLHMVEYSTGGLAREEVAARLNRLEGIVAELPPDITGMAFNRDPDSLDPCCMVTAIDAELGLVTAIDNATGRTFQFQLPDKAMLANVQMGEKVWADQKGNVGFDPVDPCCIMRARP